MLCNYFFQIYNNFYLWNLFPYQTWKFSSIQIHFLFFYNFQISYLIEKVFPTPKLHFSFLDNFSKIFLSFFYSKVFKSWSEIEKKIGRKRVPISYSNIGLRVIPSPFPATGVGMGIQLTDTRKNAMETSGKSFIFSKIGL